MIKRILQNLLYYISDAQSRAVGLIFVLNAMIFSTWAVRIPDIKAALDINDGQLGFALLAAPLGVVLFAPVTTFCINRFGAGRTTIAAAALMSLSIIILGLPQSYAQLWTALLVFGICNGVLDISMNAVASALEKQQNRIIMSTTHGFWSLGAMVFSLIAGVIAGWHVPYLTHFIAICVVCLVLLVIIQKNIFHIVDHQESAFKLVWPGKHLALLILIAFIVFMSEGVVLDWNSVFYKDILNAPAAAVGFGFAAFSTSMAVARFSGDVILEKYPLKRILLIATLICIIGLWFYALGISLLISTVAMLICGFGFSILVPVLFREAGRAEGIAPSLGLAMVSTLGYMGFLIGPPLIGFVSEASDLKTGFFLVGILMVIGLMLISQVRD